LSKGPLPHDGHRLFQPHSKAGFISRSGLCAAFGSDCVAKSGWVKPDGA
jgi:hypothetical protein